MDGEAIHSQISQAVNEWETSHDYDHAVMHLERLQGVSGGNIEQARLTALAMIHLERGNRQAFLQSANQLATMIGSFEFVEPQARHVLVTAWAMQGKSTSELPGRGYDDRRVQSTYRLLGGE